MKKKYNIFILPLIVVSFFIALLLVSCFKELSNDDVDCSTYDYSDCNTIEPDKAKLSVKLTINTENQSVPITIYSGKFEDNNIFLVDTVAKDNYDTLLPIGYYTVAAKYIKGSDTILAMDGAKTSKSKNVTCDSTCWKVTSADFNVKLK